MNNYLDKVDLVRFTDRINESFRGRIKYKGTLPIIPTGQTTRGDWSDIAPCYVGHAYVLTGSAEQYIVIDDIRYNVGDLVFATNEVTKDSSGGLSATVTVQKISGVANPRIDNKTIIENQDPTYSRGGDFMTAVGGWTETSKNQLAAERKLTLDAVATEIKVPAKAYPTNGESVMITMVYPSGGSTSESGTYDSYTKKVTTITYYIESDETTSPYITIKNKDASAFAAGSYSVKVSITKATDVESIHTSDPKYIEKDNYTVVIDDLGSVKAKSAIEINTFPDFALAKTEVLYRLLTNQIISGKQYPAGLYVCDKSDAANPQWLSVGGTKMDEKTIKTSLTYGTDVVPAHTEIGGYIKKFGLINGIGFLPTVTTDANGEVTNQSITLNKIYIDILIEENALIPDNIYQMQFDNINIDKIKVVHYPVEKQHTTNSSFELKGDFIDIKVSYDGTNYIGITNITKEAGLSANTTYTDCYIYFKSDLEYSYVDNTFLNIDDITITDKNPTNRTAGPLHAKSAIEVTRLPSTNILLETIYHLTESYKDDYGYSKIEGLYIYDSSQQFVDLGWTRIGGDTPDNKTIRSYRNYDTFKKYSALHTDVPLYREFTSDKTLISTETAATAFTHTAQRTTLTFPLTYDGDLDLTKDNLSVVYEGIVITDTTGKKWEVPGMILHACVYTNKDRIMFGASKVDFYNNRNVQMQIVRDTAASTMTARINIEGLTTEYFDNVASAKIEKLYLGTQKYDNYNMLDAGFVQTDEATIVKERHVLSGKNSFGLALRAKSAIETDKLSTITNPFTETIYRLTAEETISGKKYAPGLYVYDKTDPDNPVWISVGGSEVDEKTVLSKDDDGNLTPLHTRVGGWLDRTDVSSNTKTTTLTDAESTYTFTDTKMDGIWGVKAPAKVTVTITEKDTTTVILDMKLNIAEVAGWENTFSFSTADIGFVVTRNPGVDFTIKMIHHTAAYSKEVDVVFTVDASVIHHLDTDYIKIDKETIVSKKVLSTDEVKTLRAKSALEVDSLSGITSPLTETIYRLTTEETISGKKYAKGLYVYDISGTTPVWLSVGGSEVDEKTILSTDDNGEHAALHTRVGGWLEDTAYTTGDNGTATTDGQYTFAVTVNPTNVSKCEVGKSVVVYKYTIGTTTGTETLTCESATKFSNATSGSKAEYDGTMLTLFTFKNTAITTGSNIIIDVKFQEEDPEYYKKIHYIDSDYINIDSKTIIRVNDSEEFDHFETCIGGWKEEGIIDKVDSLGTGWGFGTTSGGMGSSITDTSKFIRGTTFHEGDLLIFEGKFTDGNSNVLVFEYNSSSTTEYKYAFKGVSPLTTSSYIEIYISSASNEYWSGSFNYPEGTYRTGTAASARAVFNTTVWHKIDSRYLNADNISIYNTNPLDDSLSTLKSRAIITTASVSANNLTTDVIYNLTSSVYYEGKSYKAGLYRYDGISNLIPITNAAADQKTIVGNVISGDPLHTAVGGYKTTTTEIRYGGLDNYTFIEGPQEVTFPAVSYPENGDQITLYVHTTDGSGSWSRGTYNATTKQATLDNGGMTCYVDKTVSKYWKISFVKGMYVGKTCILDLYRKVDTPEEVLVYSDPHFIDKDNETIVLDNIDKLKAKSAIEISTFPVFALAATEVIYRTTSDQTIEGKSYPKGLYVCDKSDADNPKWISVGMAKLDEKTIRSTNDSGESVPVYTQIGGWKETNYTASIDYGTPLLSEFMYGDNYWDLTFDYTYGTKPSKDTDYIMVDYETADGNQYNGKLTRISIDENNAVYAESTGATPLCRFVNHLNNNTATLYFFANAYGDSLTKSGSISYVSEDIIHHVDSKYINIDNETIILDADDKIETSIGGVVGEYETKTIAENIKGHAKETTYSFSFIVPDLEETNESNNVQDTYYEIIFKRNSGSEESPSWTRVKFTGYADVSNKIGFNGGYIMKGKIEVLEGSFYQYYFKYWEFVTEQHKIYYHSDYYDVYSDMNKVMLESVKVTKKTGYQNISSEVMNADAVYNNKPYYINIVDVDELPAEPVVGIKYRLKSTGVVQMWSGYGTQKLSDSSSLWSRWYPVAEAIDNATIAYNSYGQIGTALGGSYDGSYSSSSIVRSQIEPYRKWVSVGDNYNSFTGFYIQTDYIGYDITKAICNQSSVNFADITIKFTTVDNVEMSETINKVPMTQMYDYGDSYLADYSINGSALSSTTNPYFSKCDQITLHAGGFNKLANISFTCYKSKAEFGIDIEKPIYITYWGISYSTYYNMAKWAMMPLDSGTFKPVYTNAQAPMALNIGGSVDVHTAEIGICYDGVDLTKTDFDDHSELSYQGTGLYLPIDTYYTDQYFNTSLYICYVKGDSTTYIPCYRRADLDYIYQKSNSYKAAVYMYNQTAALDKTNHVVIYHTSTAADRKIVIHIAKDTSTYTFLRLTNAFFTTDKMTNKLIANSIPFNSNTDYINASGEITPVIGGGRKFGSDTHVPCNSSHTNINNRTSASWGDIIPSSINNKIGYFDVWYKFSDGTTQNHKYITLKQENNIYYLAEEGYTDPYAAGIIFNYGEELIEFHTAAGTWPETDVDIVVYTKTIESLEKINNSYVNIDNSTIKVNTEGKLMANYSYGTTLPASGTEGQVFFLYS